MRIPGAQPRHDLVAIGLDAVGDGGEDQNEAETEGDVAGPVDLVRDALGISRSFQ